MTNNSMDTTYKILRYAYFLQKCLGLVNFRIEGDAGKRYFVPISKTSFYKMLSVSVALFMSGALFIGDFNIAFSPDEPIGWYIDMYQAHSRVLLIISIVVCYKYFYKIILKNWKISMLTDRQMDSLNIPTSNNYNLRWNFLWLGINLIITSSLSLRYALPLFEKMPRSHLSIYVICSIYKIATVFTIQSWMLLLRHRFRCLNQYLRRKAKIYMCYRDRLAVYKIKLFSTAVHRIAEVHQELSNICITFNEIHCIPILLNIAFDFSKLIIGAYRFSQGITRNVKWDHHLQTVNVTNIFLCTVNVIGLTVACGRLSKQVRIYFDDFGSNQN